MASMFKSGLTGGAAANNVNVISHYMGRAIVRCTTVDTTTYSARTVMGRTSVDDYTATTPYTVKNT